jgi:hypothetical protein
MKNKNIPLSEEDVRIIDKAAKIAIEQLDLDPKVPICPPMEYIRLYDNLAALCGGDEELMRHWMSTGNKHLAYTPGLRVHQSHHLEEMNIYLESLRRA